MKKCVGMLLIILLMLFVGCSRRAKGNVREMTRYSWAADLAGGGEMNLSFDGACARLTVQNGKDSVTIQGKMLADEGELVIFDEALHRNYGFTYVPRGEKLDLTYAGHTVEMHKSAP